MNTKILTPLRRSCAQIRNRSATCLSFVLIALAASSAGAAGLLIADGGLGGVLEVEEHTARVTISHGIAVTEVHQIFRNTENRPVEALYTFPVPKGASVANFSMWIGGQEMIGEVIEKERAREIYNSYKNEMRDPGLLEQVDYKTFEMRIFPIAARAEQRVQITYYQELDFDHDRATYVYPLATVTHEGRESRTTGRFALDLDVRSLVPIVELDSPSHGNEFVVVAHSDDYFQASLETEGGDLNQDLVLHYRIARPHTGLDLVTSKAAGEDGFFQLTLTAGSELDRARPGMDYVFVLDISGSMDRDGKLALSRGSIGAFIGELALDDRFEVLAFNTAPQTLFRGLRPADTDALSQARDFLTSQQAGGGTVLRPALELAYRFKDPDRPLNVVILSDGMTDQDERHQLLELIPGRPAGTRVFCVGVGHEINRPLLSQIAEEAGGLAAFLSRSDDFALQAAAFRRKLIRPAASNLQIEIDGVDVYDLEPRQLPDLFHGSPVRLYGRYAKAGAAKIRIHGDLGGESLDQWLELDFPDRDPTSPEIERMWAWHRVQGLDREVQSRPREGRSPSRDQVVDEIVRLGEAFSIVTEYTSFLVLENDAEYRRWKIERRNALRLERDRQKQRRLRQELEELRRRSALALGPTSEAEPPLQAQPPSTQEARAQPPTPPQPPPQTAPTERRRSGRVGQGGGALDPLAGALVALAAGLGWIRRLNRRKP